MRVAVVGLGKLGSPFAALLASKGHDVVGVDLNAEYVGAVNRQEAPVAEPGLSELMLEVGDNLSATTEIAEAGSRAEVAFVVVPTPSRADGSFDISYVLSAVSALGEAFRADEAAASGRRVVVVTSTVLPGSTAGPIAATLEKAAGKEIGETLGLCYSPEFIALGSVIADMRNPDFVLIGESAGWAGEVVAEVVGSITENDPAICRMPIVDAEVTKIAVNTFVTTKISYANMIGEICDRLPGADALVVTAALGLDSRIGRRYLSPGPAYGGPCFPRDNAALAALARSLGVSADIAEATDAVNRRQAPQLAEEVAGVLGPGEKVAVLGLSYKAGTGVADESFGLALALALSERGIRVTAYDPAVPEEVVKERGVFIELAASAAECVEGAAAVVVATDWPEFSEIGSLVGRLGSAPRLVVDMWGGLRGLDPSVTAVRRPGAGSLGSSAAS